MEINYIGEHLFVGRLGHLFAILSMVAAIVSTISYFFAANKRETSEEAGWKKLARASFSIHSFSVLAIAVTLFYMIFNQFWEFQYVWQHSSKELPVYYMISCFWEGQEGSFLLWTFWHCILGLVIMKTAKKWEAPVMTMLSVTQIFLAAMLIGIYFFGYKIGSSPFALMREVSPQFPIFQRANYLDVLLDGNGLNPLLQNYWMVIHPPVLFLGFASVIFPFAYSIAGLWYNDFSKAWTLPTLRWTLFACAFLGIGIIMGGAWAYESLSFGGYWAWDPVENASLVPWIVLICGLHTLLAYKNSGHSLRSTVFFFILSFLLILYSTYLTRSGVLGDTSVHAFTGEGMAPQLLVFLLGFVLFSFAFYFLRLPTMPLPNDGKEEPSKSKEFWLFVGSLVLMIVSIIVIVSTSLPVFNSINANLLHYFPFLADIPGLGDFLAQSYTITGSDGKGVVDYYNSRLIWLGSIALIICTIAQYLRFRSSKTSGLSKLLIPTVFSLGLAGLLGYSLDFPLFVNLNFPLLGELPFLSPYFLLLAASIFAIVGNLGYFFQVLKGNIAVAGSSVAHLGFGLMMLGVLISGGKSEVISLNQMDLDYGDEFSADAKRENVYLPQDIPTQMGDYWITYKGSQEFSPDTYYEIFYERKENKDDVAKESFSLYPYAQVNPKMGLVSNPDTKHYWSQDVFTHVSSIPDKEAEAEDAAEIYNEVEIAQGDTAVTSSSIIFFDKIIPNPTRVDFIPQEGDIAVAAALRVTTLSDTYPVEPIYYVRDNREFDVPARIDEIGMEIRFLKVDPATGKIKLAVTQKEQSRDFVILKAIVFPWISILWLGTIVLAIGFLMSLVQRWREGRKLKTSTKPA